MIQLEQIRAVTFDAGGTLIKPHPSVGHIYAEVAARHGSKALPEALNRRFATAWSQRPNFSHSREEWASLVDEIFIGIVPQPPSQTFFNELFDRFEERSAWLMFDDVFPALEDLASKGYQIGIISNWDERLRPLLKAFDLTKYFDAIIVSCETGFSKPSPIIFDMATRKFGLAPDEILHIGDSPKHDDAGARAAGFQSLLIKRDGGEPDAHQIVSLRDLKMLPSLLIS